MPVDAYLQVLQHIIALKKLHLPEEDLDKQLAYLDDQLFDGLLPAITCEAVNSRVTSRGSVQAYLMKREAPCVARESGAGG
ncbi:MAG: hypothetical protein ACFFD4_11560 [Candidatus Odinarchaeota archaeon]